jgi:DNA-binding response OmpR family regulator
MEDIWGKDIWDDTENIRINIRRLRKKLHDIPPRMILNKHGIGYILQS